MGLLRENKRPYIHFIFAILIFFAYGNALFNGFVYDDGYLIVNNDTIKSLSHIKMVLTKDVTEVTPIGQASGYYRPVAMLFLMFTYKIWGLSAFGFHLGSILIHVANTSLVFCLLKAISRDFKVAFIAALLFAVHPVHVESVTPIYNFMGLLASLFALTSFLAFVKSDGLRKKKYFVLSAIMLFLGIFTKEEVFILPCIFILYDYFFFSDLRFLQIARRWRFYVVYFLIVTFYILMRLMIIEREAALGLWGFKLTFNIVPAGNQFLHALTIIKIYYRYLVLLFFPINLSAFHVIDPVKSIVGLDSLFATLTVLGLIIGVFAFRKRAPIISFFISLFVISTFPFSNVIPIGGLFAERFMYFPSISCCFLIAFILAKLMSLHQDTLKGTAKKTAILLSCIIIFLYAFKTAIRNYIWINDIALWEDTVKQSPGHQLPHLQLANAYFESKIYDKALNEYKKSLEISPFKEFYIRNAIGKIYGIKNQHEQALKEFRRVLALNSRFIEAYYNIGITYFNSGDSKQAQIYFQKAMKMHPEYPWSYYGLGLIYEKKGEAKMAKAMYSKALALNPDFKLARQAYERIGGSAF